MEHISSVARREIMTDGGVILARILHEKVVNISWQGGIGIQGGKCNIDWKGWRARVYWREWVAF